MTAWRTHPARRRRPRLKALAALSETEPLRSNTSNAQLAFLPADGSGCMSCHDINTSIRSRSLSHDWPQKFCGLASDLSSSLSKVRANDLPPRRSTHLLQIGATPNLGEIPARRERQRAPQRRSHSPPMEQSHSSQPRINREYFKR